MTDRLRAHVKALAGERHPHTSPDQLSRVEAYLADRFRERGLSVTTHEFAALGGTYRNVVATLPECENATAAPLLIGAHFDTVAGSPGADDNASACAVLLEVACGVASQPVNRPIRFVAFNLEEEDRLGSRAYAADLRAAGQSLHGAIVMECVGYTSQAEGSQRRPAGVPVPVPTVGNFLAVIGNESSQGLLETVLSATRRHVPDLIAIPLLVPECGERLPDTRRSDHASFWDQGWPALMLTDTANFRNPHYHGPSDTIDTLDFQFMAKVVDAIEAAAREWAGAHP